MITHPRKFFVFMILTLTVLSLVFPFSVHAQIPDKYTLLEPLPCLNGPGCEVGTQVTTTSFENYAQYAFTLLIAMAAVLSVLFIVWGGFVYMTADAWTGKKSGLEHVQNALFGLLLILVSYLILKTVHPQFVEIPSTLVPQLAIDCKKSSNNPLCARNVLYSFLNQLENDADKWKVKDAELSKKITEAIKIQEESTKNQESLVQQRDALLKQGFNENDPEIQSLQEKIENEGKKAGAALGNVELLALKAKVTRSILAEATDAVKQSTTLGEVKNVVTQYVDKLNKYTNEKDFYGNSQRDEVYRLGGPEAVKQLNDWINYSIFSLFLLETQNVYRINDAKLFTLYPYKKEALGELDALDKKIGTLNDPDLRQEISDRSKQLRELIETRNKQ